MARSTRALTKSTPIPRNQDEEQWKTLFLSWQGPSSSNVANEWYSFFKAFNGLLPTEQSPKERVADLALFAQFFALFGYMHRRYYASGAATSMWTVTGLGCDEVRTCAVLAWLLDRHATHGQGDAFLRCFLECMHESVTRSGQILPAMPAIKDVAKGYSTRVESWYDTVSCEEAGGSNSRVDIEIDGADLLLLIEAKVYASETNNQLARYLAILSTMAGSRSRSLVFLTPTGRAPMAGSAKAHGEIVAVGWKSIAARFKRYINSTMPKDGFGTVFIRQFCEHISNF